MIALISDSNYYFPLLVTATAATMREVCKALGKFRAPPHDVPGAPGTRQARTNMVGEIFL